MKLKEIHLSSRQMLLDIAAMHQQAKKYLNLNKSYNLLLETLVSMNFYYDEDSPMPSIKELSSKTGLKYNLVRKQIRQIYEDLVFGLDNNIDHLFTFTAIRYNFILRGYSPDRSLYVSVDQLPRLPRVGEGLEIPYFKAYLETDWFYVEDVRHKLDSNGQTIEIWLKPGRYNLYWHYRKDKAEEENEISWNDFYKKDDWEIKKKLGIGRRI